MPTIEERVLRAIRISRPDTIIDKKADLFRDLGYDSLDLMELIMALEDEFDMNISNNSYENVKTTEDIISMIQEYCELANDTCE